MTIKQQLVQEISEAVKQLDISDIEVKVDYPVDSKNGDYSSNIAMGVFGKGKALSVKGKVISSPMELAELLAQQLRTKNQELKTFEKVEVVKPGFINFFIADKFFVQKLQNDIDSGLEISQIGEKKKVVVEYSSPNIAKPFTIGHLRSTVIGDAIANLLEATGHKVYRDNHVGDWGTQFGKQIYAIKMWGDEEEIEKSGQPVKLLVDLYIKFHEEAAKNPELEDRAREWFKKLEGGDIEARELWQKCIDWSWKEFDQIYKQLGVKFTENNGRGYGESFFENKMQVVIDELEKKELLEIGKEGGKIVSFPEQTRLPPLMIIKKDGTTLYATRDLATDKFRLGNYGQDLLIINEAEAEQVLYFRQLYKVEEILGWYRKDQRVHIKHGLYRFKDQKMSTRRGNVIWLDEVIEEAIKRAGELAKDTEKDISEIVAIGALKWNDLKRSPEQDIVFDWDDLLNMQGNSGPYIQYAYVRTQSVLERGKREALSVKNPALPAGRFTLSALPLTLVSEERELLRLLTKFDEVVIDAAERFAPNILCIYLFELAQGFNLFYQKCPILKAADESKNFRLVLTFATGQIIKNSLSLLGISAPDKM